MTNPDTCDTEIYEKGEPVAIITGSRADIESFVQRIASRSGQRVDWHYVGGRAVVKVLGDAHSVRDAITWEALHIKLVYPDD